MHAAAYCIIVLLFSSPQKYVRNKTITHITISTIQTPHKASDPKCREWGTRKERTGMNWYFSVLRWYPLETSGAPLKKRAKRVG
jgi:hypothetical protein